jgi:hypothetical protein
MKSQDTSDLLLVKHPTDDKYIWSDPDFPRGKISRLFELSGPLDDMSFDYIVAKDGGISYIYKFDASIDGEPGIDRENMRMLLIADMVDHMIDHPAADYEELCKIARSNHLARGISMEIDGRKVELCGKIREDEIEEDARAILEDIEIRSILRNLPELSRNLDRDSRFLYAENASIKEKLARRYAIDVADDMDLVVEVEARYSSTIKDYMFSPVSMFNLSKFPRFDYESSTLTGVGLCYDAEGEQTHHTEIWAAKAIMNRLPEEDLVHEDAAFYIGVALDKLADADPAPEI